MPESLNEAHELVLVAGELDDSSERIINYLAEEYGWPSTPCSSAFSVTATTST